MQHASARENPDPDDAVLGHKPRHAVTDSQADAHRVASDRDGAAPDSSKRRLCRPSWMVARMGVELDPPAIPLVLRLVFDVPAPAAALGGITQTAFAASCCGTTRDAFE